VILFVSTMEGAPWGGSEQLWRDAAIRLGTQGYEVSVSAKAWSPPPREWAGLEEAGVRLLLRDRVGDPAYGRHYKSLLSARPEAVVISAGDNGLSGVHLMELFGAAGIPYIVVCHGSVLFWPADEILERARRAFERAHKMLFVSRRNQAYTELMIGTALPNAGTVRSPVSIPYDVRLPWPENSVVHMACVGRLDPTVKGQDLLFQVLKSDRWKRRPLRVSLYGTGPNEASLRRLKTLFDLPMVHFAGVADPQEIWRREQILVLPSRSEGLPLVLVEAMLAARPAIATNVGESAEVISDGQTGFIAAAPDVAMLDAAMERAWSRRDEWRAMGEEAARTIREQAPADPVGIFVEEMKRSLGVEGSRSWN
jgi:glycosyltransferase involved in cell wall biosynthesis